MLELGKLIVYSEEPCSCFKHMQNNGKLLKTLCGCRASYGGISAVS